MSETIRVEVWLARIVLDIDAFVLSILDGAFCIYHSLSSQVREQALLSDTDTWSDEDIIKAIQSSPFLEGSDKRLIQISKDIVVKLCPDWGSTISEALAMDLVSKQTRIAVPRMRRTINYIHPEGDGLIVMDLVQHSQRLQVTWPELSHWRKLVIILTMRSYLRQLRRIQHHLYTDNNRPGPLGPSPQLCNGLQFGFDSKGPFPTVSALETYFRTEHRNAEARASRGWSPSPDCKPLDTSAFSSLVFTHNDLNMRNLLLDKNYALWVIDWGFSGLYPPWFEYLGMRFAAQKDRDAKSWQQCIKYMAEPAFEFEEWMKRIGYDYNPPQGRA